MNILEKFKTKCHDLRNMLIEDKIAIDELSMYKEELFIPYMGILLDGTGHKSDYEDFLYLCLDYYTYTEDLLIPDYDYDMVMEEYKKCGGTPMTTADPLVSGTHWELVRHEMPGVVGTIKKVYTDEALEKYYDNHRCEMWAIAPKYDGISAAIKMSNCSIESALTRYDGVYGQDITKIVRSACNADTFFCQLVNKPLDGFYKVELCVGDGEFDKMNEDRVANGFAPYANRRSATSGIVNSPKNLYLAKYVTIIPLAYYSKNDLVYSPLHCVLCDNVGSAKYLLKHIKEMISETHKAGFPFRTDGCVVWPFMGTKIDELDIMSDAIAYKINTKVGLTQIRKLYVSVGRLGKAVPMANVIPVEVNETRVSDVSLGSFDKMLQMDLREGETIEVFSAGDVIPQMRLPKDRDYEKSAERLHISLICPYCGEKLKSFGREMYCRNKRCERVITGRITNFVQKLDVDGISDATIEDLYRAGLIREIRDLFSLSVSDIRDLDGYGDMSASNIIDQITQLKNAPISIDKLFGALGINGIAEKTSRKIFSVIKVKDLFKKDRLKLEIKLKRADGIGDITAQDFIKAVDENFDEIEYLYELLNIVEPRSWKGSVAFTGFRDKDLESKFNEAGYEVTDSVSKMTKLLVCATSDFSSTKCQKALKKEIPIVTRMEIENDFYDIIRRIEDRE